MDDEQEYIENLADALAAAEELLRRVEPELVPNYAEAQRLSDKFGLGTVAKTTLVPDIRKFLKEGR